MILVGYFLLSIQKWLTDVEPGWGYSNLDLRIWYQVA
jgi:hypothetical protein